MAENCNGNDGNEVPFNQAQLEWLARRIGQAPLQLSGSSPMESHQQGSSRGAEQGSQPSSKSSKVTTCKSR